MKKTYNEGYRITAEDTLEKFNNGLLKEMVEQSNKGTEYFEKYSDFGYKDIKVDDKFKLNVHVESTLQGIFRLTNEGKKNIVALNFASAKRPGGGFLKGTVAQEESLARTSSLYFSLRCCTEYYENPQAPYYSDKMIFSPNVVFIKDDAGNMLDTPVTASIITVAAPNLRDAENVDHLKIRDIFVRRIYNVLKLAKDKGCENVILGAFGCGVFMNDPRMVAKYFKWVIKQEFENSFESIVFSIYEKPIENVMAFK